MKDLQTRCDFKLGAMRRTKSIQNWIFGHQELVSIQKGCNDSKRKDPTLSLAFHPAKEGGYFLRKMNSQPTPGPLEARSGSCSRVRRNYPRSWTKDSDLTDSSYDRESLPSLVQLAHLPSLLKVKGSAQVQFQEVIHLLRNKRQQGQLHRRVMASYS